MTKNENKLIVFASWCMDYSEYTCNESQTEIQRALIDNKVETINKIGDMLDEILNSDTLDLDEEIKKAKSNYV
jgi:hypothetical protein